MTATISVRPLTSHLRSQLADDVPTIAEFAIIAHTWAGGLGLIATDVDAGVLNVTAWAETYAKVLGADYAAPEHTCDYCGRPVYGSDRFCAPRPQRDCRALYSSSEVALWQELSRDVARMSALADELGLPAVAVA